MGVFWLSYGSYNLIVVKFLIPLYIIIVCFYRILTFKFQSNKSSLNKRLICHIQCVLLLTLWKRSLKDGGNHNKHKPTLLTHAQANFMDKYIVP